MLKGQRIAASLLSSVVVLAITILAMTPVTLHAQPKPGHLDEVLRQMDAASKKFQSAEANFRWDLYERVVKETTTQTGTIYFKKVGTIDCDGREDNVAGCQISRVSRWPDSRLSNPGSTI